jgi:hypothetical protein
MDQSWCNEELNDNESSFCDIFICDHDDMGYLLQNLDEKRLCSCNFHMLGEKQKHINNFEWMNVSIAL